MVEDLVSMTHHAQRLLVAASRGARIQYTQSFGPKTWMETRNTSILFADECRIHPDDIACQYGPIATQLRLMAASTQHEWDETSIRYMADQYVYDFVTNITWEERCTVADDRDHRPWQLLFAAELAADEGM